MCASSQGASSGAGASKNHRHGHRTAHTHQHTHHGARAGYTSVYKYVKGPGFVWKRKKGDESSSSSSASLEAEPVDYLGKSDRTSRQQLEQFNAFLLEDPNSPDMMTGESLLPILYQESTDTEEQAMQQFAYSKRRTKLLQFTCKLCQTRTEYLINPHAWSHGTIVALCSGCGVKHELIDNLGVFNPPPPKVKKMPRYAITHPIDLFIQILTSPYSTHLAGLT